eukprot:4491379-Pleurochrysis_carterae.AAC.1
MRAALQGGRRDVKEGRPRVATIDWCDGGFQRELVAARAARARQRAGQAWRVGRGFGWSRAHAVAPRRLVES